MKPWSLQSRLIALLLVPTALLIWAGDGHGAQPVQ
jgi:hypothetical protein